MAGIFQRNIFQNNVFQVGQVVPVSLGVSGALTLADLASRQQPKEGRRIRAVKAKTVKAPKFVDPREIPGFPGWTRDLEPASGALARVQAARRRQGAIALLLMAA